MFEALELPPGATDEQMQAAVAGLESAALDAAARRDRLRAAMDATLMGFGGGHGVEMNQRYTSSAVVPDGSPGLGFERDPVFFHQPSTRPGAHLPHVWLTTGQRPISSLDLCGKGRFTLLTGLAGKLAWEVATQRVSQAFGIEIVVRVIRPGQAYEDAWGDYRKVSEVDDSGALLVRPDMFVAWRAHDHTSAAGDELLDAMQAVLGTGST